MLLRLLGVIDLMVALLLLASHILPKDILVVAAIYIILKGLVFVLAEDIISYVDIAIGLYIFLLMFGFSSNILSLLAALFLIQKGLASIS